jgi:hypothetical protein
MIFQGAGCDNDNYLVVVKVRERLAVNKHSAQQLDGERFNLRKVNELEVGYNIRSKFQTGLYL